MYPRLLPTTARCRVAPFHSYFFHIESAVKGTRSRSKKVRMPLRKRARIMQQETRESHCCMTKKRGGKKAFDRSLSKCCQSCIPGLHECSSRSREKKKKIPMESYSQSCHAACVAGRWQRGNHCIKKKKKEGIPARVLKAAHPTEPIDSPAPTHGRGGRTSKSDCR